MIKRISAVSAILFCIFLMTCMTAYADTDIVLTEDTVLDKIEDTSITISGKYMLTVKNGINATSGAVTIRDAEVTVENGGIYATGNILIENACVDSYSQESVDHHGPRAISSDKGTVTINNSTVYANVADNGSYLISAETGFKAEGSTINLGKGADCSCGIAANSDGGANIEMKDCTVNANIVDGDGLSSYRGSVILENVIGELYTGSEGISGGDKIELNNCRIFIEGGKDEPGAGLPPGGMFAYSTIDVNGGWLKTSSALGDGMYANGDITISADTEYVEASGKEYGIRVGVIGKINIGAGLKIITPEGGSVPEGATMVVDKDGYTAKRVVIQGKAAPEPTAKKANPLKIKAKTYKVKYKTLKKKAVTLKPAQVIKFVNKGEGTKQYKITSGNKKITINKKTGKVTIKKGLKKGKYPVKIKVTAKGNDAYDSKTLTVKSTIKVV